LRHIQLHFTCLLQSSVILHYIQGGAAGLRDARERHTRLARGNGDDRTTSGPPELRPTHFPAHYVFLPGSPPPGPPSAIPFASLLPDTLVITEWPADNVSAALAAATDECDALLFVVNPSSESSVSYFCEHVCAVPDGVPVSVVMTRHEPSPTKDVCVRLLTKLCSASSTIDLSEEATLLENTEVKTVVASHMCGLDLELDSFTQKVMISLSSFNVSAVVSWSGKTFLLATSPPVTYKPPSIL
jgi:hypothetical protein